MVQNFFICLKTNITEGSPFCKLIPFSSYIPHCYGIFNWDFLLGCYQDDYCKGVVMRHINQIVTWIKWRQNKTSNLRNFEVLVNLFLKLLSRTNQSSFFLYRYYSILNKYVNTKKNLFILMFGYTIFSNNKRENRLP